jgi:hypothetical protein
VALAIRVPKQVGGIAIGRLAVGAATAEFHVTALSRLPPKRLVFPEVRVRPGHTALSAVAAPSGYRAGASLSVSGAEVEVETRAGRRPLPTQLTPGEPFRLVTRLPPDATSGLTLLVELGPLSTEWSIRPP